MHIHGGASQYIVPTGGSPYAQQNNWQISQTHAPVHVDGVSI